MLESACERSRFQATQNCFDFHFVTISAGVTARRETGQEGVNQLSLRRNIVAADVLHVMLRRENEVGREKKKQQHWTSLCVSQSGPYRPSILRREVEAVLNVAVTLIGRSVRQNIPQEWRNDWI